MDQNESSNSMSGTGYLLVRASTALGAIPVEGATVTVRDNRSKEESEDRGSIIRVMLTDQDGRSEKIALPAPPRSQSMTPNGTAPYATYTVDVVAPGYYRLYFQGVPIYDTITSIQPAMLIPIAENGSTDGVALQDGYFEENVNPALRSAHQ